MILAEINLDLTQIILAFMAGLPAMIAAIVTLIITLRENRKTRVMVEDESTKATIIANDVKVALVESAKVSADVKVALADSEQIVKTSNADLNSKLDDIVHTGNVTHALVNSNLGIVLHEKADGLKRIAKLDPNEKNTQTAKEAQKDADNHDKGQVKADKIS